LLLTLPALLRGRRSAFGSIENGYFSHNTHEVKLSLAGGFTLDGQLYTPENRKEPTVVRYGGTADFVRIQ
jgi:hypothetical protein